MPPRSASRSRRSRPISRRRTSGSSAAPRSIVGLDARVVEPGPTADRRALEAGRGRRAGRVEVDRPQQRRTFLVGQEARGSLAELVREHRRASVGQVLRHAPDERLAVERAPGRDERGDVGDRVVDAIAVRASFGVVRLVEIHGIRRIDRDERQVARVEPIGGPHAGGRHRTARRDRCCFGLDVGRERGRDLELGPDAREGFREGGEPAGARTIGDGMVRAPDGRGGVRSAARPSMSGSWARMKSTAASGVSATVISSPQPNVPACRRTAARSSGCCVVKKSRPKKTIGLRTS